MLWRDYHRSLSDRDSVLCFLFRLRFYLVCNSFIIPVRYLCYITISLNFGHYVTPTLITVIWSFYWVEEMFLLRLEVWFQYRLLFYSGKQFGIWMNEEKMTEFVLHVVLLLFHRNPLYFIDPLYNFWHYFFHLLYILVYPLKSSSLVFH